MKVFSKDAWLKDMLTNATNVFAYVKYYINESTWQNACEGKTSKECEELGYTLNNKWFIEKGEQENGTNI